jgi:hypothetical protein
MEGKVGSSIFLPKSWVQRFGGGESQDPEDERKVRRKEQDRGKGGVRGRIQGIQTFKLCSRPAYHIK